MKDESGVCCSGEKENTTPHHFSKVVVSEGVDLLPCSLHTVGRIVISQDQSLVTGLKEFCREQSEIIRSRRQSEIIRSRRQSEIIRSRRQSEIIRSRRQSEIIRSRRQSEIIRSRRQSEITSSLDNSVTHALVLYVQYINIKHVQIYTKYTHVMFKCSHIPMHK